MVEAEREKMSGNRKARSNHFNVSDYLDEIESIRERAETDLSDAGEQALKLLDGFLADYANSLGLDNERPSMYDSIQFLEPLGGQAQSIASRAERYRGTRNALAHNADLMLRPSAATRIIASIEKLVRSAAETAFGLSNHPPACVGMNELARQARDEMIERGYRQLVVVNDDCKFVDVLTYRDIVAVEALREIDKNGDGTLVGDLVQRRDFRAAVPVARSASVGEVANALSDQRYVAAVVTENGEFGEAPLGVITRGDILRVQS